MEPKNREKPETLVAEREMRMAQAVERAREAKRAMPVKVGDPMTRTEIGPEATHPQLRRED